MYRCFDFPFIFYLSLSSSLLWINYTYKHNLIYVSVCIILSLVAPITVHTCISIQNSSLFIIFEIWLIKLRSLCTILKGCFFLVYHSSRQKKTFKNWIIKLKYSIPLDKLKRFTANKMIVPWNNFKKRVQKNCATN